MTYYKSVYRRFSSDQVVKKKRSKINRALKKCSRKFYIKINNHSFKYSFLNLNPWLFHMLRLRFPLGVRSASRPATDLPFNFDFLLFSFLCRSDFSFRLYDSLDESPPWKRPFLVLLLLSLALERIFISLQWICSTKICYSCVI